MEAEAEDKEAVKVEPKSTSGCLPMCRFMDPFCNCLNNVGCAWADENRKLLCIAYAFFLGSGVISLLIAAMGLSAEGPLLKALPWMVFDVDVNGTSTRWHTNLWGLRLDRSDVVNGQLCLREACDAFPSCAWDSFFECTREANNENPCRDCGTQSIGLRTQV